MSQTGLKRDVLFIENGTTSKTQLGGIGNIALSNSNILSFTSDRTYIETKNAFLGNAEGTNNKIHLYGQVKMEEEWTFKNSILIGDKENSPTECMINLDGQVLVSYAITHGITGGLNATPGTYTNLSVSSNSTDGTGLTANVEIDSGNITIQAVNSGNNYSLGDIMTIQAADVSASSDITFTVSDYMGGGYPIVFFGENTTFDETHGHQSGSHNAGDIFSNGDMYADTYLSTSDETHKTNIADLEMMSLSNINPVIFNWKDQHKDQDDKFGFLAQEISKIHPNIVNAKTPNHFSMEYVQLLPIIIQQLQSLKTSMDDTESILNRYIARKDEVKQYLDSHAHEILNASKKIAH